MDNIKINNKKMKNKSYQNIICVKMNKVKKTSNCKLILGRYYFLKLIMKNSNSKLGKTLLKTSYCKLWIIFKITQIQSNRLPSKHTLTGQTKTLGSLTQPRNKAKQITHSLKKQSILKI